MNNPQTTDITTLQITCLICRTKHTIQLPTQDVTKWQSGTLVQVAFPYLDVDVRELLVSNICGDCYDAMFPEE